MSVRLLSNGRDNIHNLTWPTSLPDPRLFWLFSRTPVPVGPFTSYLESGGEIEENGITRGKFQLDVHVCDGRS